MIKANVLRVGNFVFDFEYFKITSVDELGVNRNMDFVLGDGTQITSYRCSIDTICGIPLTPEILKKANVSLLDIGYEYKWTVSGRLEIRIAMSYITTISYLHEYQNLYFALTGDELQINL